MPHKDPEVRRAYKKAYREKNRAVIAERMRQWSAKNPEWRRAYNRAYRLANLDKIKAQKVLYAAAHKEEKRAYNHAYRQAHLEKLTQAFKTWRTQHVERLRAYNRAYRQAHYERLIRQQLLYCQMNRAKRNAKQRAYAKANPDKINILVAKRRAQKRTIALHDLTDAQWQAIKKVHGSRCAYCGIKPKRLTMDHVTPISKGGAHTLHNIVPACQSCNSQKHTGPPLRPVQPLLL